MTGGRYYGLGNNSSAILTVHTLVLIGALVARYAERGQRRRAVASVLVVGLVALVVIVWPAWGADIGGALALLPVEAYRQSRAMALEVPAVTIEDAPRFRHRGLHLDVARNFHPIASVERLLRLMAFYKLNRFHLHLTDDEGWRFEVASLPELARVGGRRGHTLDESDHLVPSFGSGPVPGTAPGSGAYTRAELVGISAGPTDRVQLPRPPGRPGRARG